MTLPRLNVRPSTFLFDLDETWYVRRGRWVMHDGNLCFPWSRSRSRGSECCQKWPHARSIGSDGTAEAIFGTLSRASRSRKFLFRPRARSRDTESRQIWPQARSISSDRVNGSEWRFPYYQSLEPSPGRNGAGIFDFVPGVLSRDTEFKLFVKISKLYWTEAGDDR